MPPAPARRDAIERHSTPRCFLPGDDEAPVLREFPSVQPKVAYGSMDASSEEELPVGLDGRPAGEGSSAALAAQA